MSTAANPITPSKDLEPDILDIPGYCEARWDEAVLVCKNSLAEKDYRKVLECSTCEQLLVSIHQKANEYTNQRISPLLKRVEPFLSIIRQLTLACALTVRNHFVASGIIWGLVSLLIEVAARSEEVLSRTVDMIDELSGHMELLHVYNPLDYGNPLLDKAVVEVFIEIIIFWSHTVKFLRRHPIEVLAISAWPTDVWGEFRKTSSRVDSKIKHVRAIISAIDERRSRHGISKTEVLDEFSNLGVRDANKLGTKGTDIIQATSTLPCHNIPLLRNRIFFGRQSTLDYIYEVLIQEHDLGPRGIVVWGAAGIGKTQIALAVAHKAQDAGTPVILWMSADTELSLDQSFVDGGVLLRLPGIKKNSDPRDARSTVLTWLKSTENQWLMVLDNVNDTNSIADCWASTGTRGSVLVTSRTELEAAGNDLVSYEVPIFNDEQGAQLIQNVVSRDSYSEEERKAALRLTREVGGLALALVVLATQIRLRRTQINAFYDLYCKHAQQIYEKSKNTALAPYYTASLNTVWNVAFQSLGSQTSRFFCALCLLAPDNIPESLFTNTTAVELPDLLSFCADEWEFEEVVQELLKAALIRKSPENNMLFVHRVIQLNYRIQIDRSTYLDVLGATSTFLARSFPKHPGASFRPHPDLWAQGTQLIQHVISILAHINTALSKGFVIPGLEEFQSCFASAGRFLFDLGDFSESLRLLRAGLTLCSNKTTVHYAEILTQAGNVLALQNKIVEARQFLEAATKILEIHLSPSDIRLGVVYNFLGNIYLSEDRLDNALASYQKALNIRLSLPLEKRMAQVVGVYMNMAIACIEQGEYEEALDLIAKGRVAESSVFERGNEFEAQSYCLEARVAEARDSLLKAHALYFKSYEQFRDLQPMHPIVGAKLLRLGNVCIKQNDADQAIKFLRAAHKLAQFNEVTQSNKGDVARILRKLGQALALKNENEESRVILAQAQEFKRSIQGPQFDLSEETDKSYNKLVASYFR